MQDIITVGSMPAFELYVTHSRYCHLAVRQLAARPGTERQLRTSVVKLAKAAMVMLLSKRTSLHAELSDHFKSINSGNLSEADVSTLQASGLSLQKSECSRLRYGCSSLTHADWACSHCTGQKDLYAPVTTTTESLEALKLQKLGVAEMREQMLLSPTRKPTV